MPRFAGVDHDLVALCKRVRAGGVQEVISVLGVQRQHGNELELVAMAGTRSGSGDQSKLLRKQKRDDVDTVGIDWMAHREGLGGVVLAPGRRRRAGGGEVQ